MAGLSRLLRGGAKEGTSSAEARRNAGFAAFLIGRSGTERTARLQDLLRQRGFDITAVAPESLATSTAPLPKHVTHIFLNDEGIDQSHLRGMIEAISRKPDGPFLIVASDLLPAEIYRDLVRSATGEWVRWQSLAPDIDEALRRLTRGRAPAEAHAAAIVSFLPAGGGVGNTTHAAETAIALASRKGHQRRRVAVLDLNLDHSSIPDFLDIEPRFDLAEITADPNRLDSHLIELLKTTHSSGVDFFCSAPSEIDLAGQGEVAVFTLLDALSLRYDLIHIDLPWIWFSWLGNLLGGSDAVVVSARQTVPSIKRAAERVRRLTALSVPPSRIATVISRFEQRWFGGAVQSRDITSVLNQQTVLFVRQDAGQAEEAVNLGRSLSASAPRSRSARDIAKVAEWIDQRARDARPHLTTVSSNAGGSQ
ncbi:AAA family ATPase [Methylobacterium nodulans]|uniref:Flp pilus assembly protein ATPase CpaE-like protein n=1 Tax=Methylobacterium nodulans (strain LMG 21967 / CNCM I-2342 / ORS 2060) TaxID=460265 RepID=B8IDY6_METNO|nr:Flp pilus assembly protein ATPase CpaE-like protein [Methylobacterium nodulans]ACL57532.1 Flp pilus assembly protein ATPase CpaE-like protein [Methylobacterium nodulans ORS 2060]